MRIRQLPIPNVLCVDIEPREDERGFFARTFCERAFAAAGVSVRMVQANVSVTARRGTVRGLHFQWPPSREAKLVRCSRGALFDVLVDLRPDSHMFGRHVAVELRAATYRALFAPPGVAHGFQTLEDDTEVVYQMGDFHAPELAAGVRWNDPAFGIRWPLPAMQLSERDRGYPDFDAAAFSREYQTRVRAGGQA